MSNVTKIVISAILDDKNETSFNRNFEKFKKILLLKYNSDSEKYNSKYYKSVEIKICQSKFGNNDMPRLSIWFSSYNNNLTILEMKNISDHQHFFYKRYRTLLTTDEYKKKITSQKVVFLDLISDVATQVYLDLEVYSELIEWEKQKGFTSICKGF